MHVTVRKYADKAALIGGLVPLARDGFVALLRRTPGFRGNYTFLDEADANRGVSVSLFAARDHAREANGGGASEMRDRRIAPNPPAVIAGPTAVVAAS